MEGRDHTGQAAAPFTALLPMTPRIPGVRNQIRNALYLHVVFAAIGGSVLFCCCWFVFFFFFFYNVIDCHVQVLISS